MEALLKSSSISKLQPHLVFSHLLQTRWTSSKLVCTLDTEAALQRSRRSRAEALRTSLSVLAIRAAKYVCPLPEGPAEFFAAPITPVNLLGAVKVGMMDPLSGETTRQDRPLGPYKTWWFDRR
jgi:hypothetical protein